MTAPALVQKLWNYCNFLRDDAMSCDGSVEQLCPRDVRALAT